MSNLDYECIYGLNIIFLTPLTKNPLEAGDTVFSQMQGSKEQEELSFLVSQPWPQPNPSTPLGCPKRKKEDTCQKFISPLNDHDNPSPKRVRVIPPPYYPGIPPPILHSSKAGCQVSINLKDFSVNTHIPAQKQHNHYQVYACGSCGSKGSHILVDASSNNVVPKEIQQAEVILAALHEQNLTIRQFLVVVLDPKNEDRLLQNSQSALAAFSRDTLQGPSLLMSQNSCFTIT